MADSKKKKSTSPTSTRGSRASASRTTTPRTTTSRTTMGAASKPGNQGFMQGLESVGYLVVVAVALILASVAAYFVSFRWDLTENRRFSLAQGSEALVGGLTDTLTINAYLTTDLPPPHNATERMVRHMLEEYERAGNGNVEIVFVDVESQAGRDQAERDGIPQVPVGSTDGRSANVTQVYRGLSIYYLGDHESIRVIQDEQGLEYEISSRIRQLTQEPLTVGVVEGHGSPTLTEGLTQIRGALPSYELRAVDVSQEIDTSLRALLIVSPTEPFSDAELRRINQYVMNGGSLGVFGGTWNVEANQMGMTATHVDTNLNTLLEPWGVTLGPGMVFGFPSLSAPVQTAFGQMPASYLAAPTVPFAEDESDHPVIFRLHEAAFAWASPLITAEGFTERGGHVLARTYEESIHGVSWLVTEDSIPVQPRLRRDQWPITNERGPHTMMVAIDGNLPSAFAGEALSSDPEASNIDAPARSTAEVRVLVVGSGSILNDQFLPPADRAPPAQRMQALALPLNAIDWLAADANLIAIRAKNIQPPSIEIPVVAAEEAIQEAVDEGNENILRGEQTREEAQAAVDEAEQRLEEVRGQWDDTKFQYQLGAGIGPPLVAILFGLLIWQLRKSKRERLRDEGEKLAKKKAKTKP